MPRLYKRTSVEERFWPKVNKNGPVWNGSHCWFWTGLILSTGYGQISMGSRSDGTYKQVSTHRLAYELLLGPIPATLTIHHLCLNRPCVHPAHMVLITRAENTLRAGSLPKARIASAVKHRAMTHCKRGHPFDDSNTYRPPHSNRRVCRICHNQYRRTSRR